MAGSKPAAADRSAQNRHGQSGTHTAARAASAPEPRQDHDSETQLRSSFELRQISQDFLKLRIRGGYNWRGIQGLGERRRALAAVVMPFLIGKLPPGSRSKDLLVDTTFGELMDLTDQDLDLDLDLRSRIPESQRRKASSTCCSICTNKTY